MPSPPYALVQMSINGGGQVTGGQTGNAGNTIQLSGQSTVGWSSQRWEIFDYPISGFSAPAGWLTDASGVYYSLAVTPPLITYPASPVWGKLLFRLRINEAITSDQALAQLTDETGAFRVLSPTLGLEDIGAGETTQYDSFRSWIGAWKRMLAAFDTSGSITPQLFTGPNLTDNDQTLLIANGVRYVRVSSITAIRNDTLSMTGATQDRILVIERRETSAFNFTVTNGGPLGGVIDTFPAGTKRIAQFYCNGTDWIRTAFAEIQ
jgi:hypothetical protein